MSIMSFSSDLASSFTYSDVVLLGDVHHVLVECLGKAEVVPLYHVAAADLDFDGLPVH